MLILITDSWIMRGYLVCRLKSLGRSSLAGRDLWLSSGTVKYLRSDGGQMEVRYQSGLAGSHLVRGKAASSLSWELQGSLSTASRSCLTVRPGWWWSRQISSQNEKLKLPLKPGAG